MGARIVFEAQTPARIKIISGQLPEDHSLLSVTPYILTDEDQSTVSDFVQDRLSVTVVPQGEKIVDIAISGSVLLLNPIEEEAGFLNDMADDLERAAEMDFWLAHNDQAIEFETLSPMLVRVISYDPDWFED